MDDDEDEDGVETLCGCGDCKVFIGWYNEYCWTGACGGAGTTFIGTDCNCGLYIFELILVVSKGEAGGVIFSNFGGGNEILVCE